MTAGGEPMRLNLTILILFAGLCGAADAQTTEFAIGRAYYTEGQFKIAAAHFELALQTNPSGAESYYWAGMSYQMMADIAAPLGRKYNLKARDYLTRATELAPGRPEYRRELFNFLLDSAGSSRAIFQQAAAILRTVPESDPECTYMLRQLEQKGRANSSAEARLGRLLLAVPRAGYRIGEIPVSTVTAPHRL
jgi:tetratricopeptide (TPR) repeat protein